MKSVVRLWLMSALFAGSITAYAGCELADIDVNISKSIWHNRCSKKNCAELNGTAVLTSRCDGLIGAQVRLIGHDAEGAPIATRDMWPYAISKVSAGEHAFSIDRWLEYNPKIKGFKIEALAVKPVAP